MAREAATYRGARRNNCIRVEKMPWGPNWYYGTHINAPDWLIAQQPEARLNTLPIYIPAKKVERKRTRGKNDIYALLKSGDYAGAVRKFFSARTKAAEIASEAERLDPPLSPPKQ